MIELFFWPTPNGHKIIMALEEMDLDYQVKFVDIGAEEQFAPDFLAISPNNKMPAIIDHDGPDGTTISVFESGAILQYLAEKTGTLLSSDPLLRIQTIEWLNWQVAGFGPMLGQAHHFNFYAREKMEYPITRYSNEANRLYGVLDRRLEGREFIVGDNLSIADVAVLPWTRSYDRQNVDIDSYPHVKRWILALNQRSSVEIAYKTGAENRKDLRDLSEEDWTKLFGLKK